jgi:hypothetical protein
MGESVFGDMPVTVSRTSVGRFVDFTEMGGCLRQTAVKCLHEVLDAGIKGRLFLHAPGGHKGGISVAMRGCL